MPDTHEPEEIEVLDFDPRNLPKECLAAIGLATAAAAQTERIMESAISGCLGVDMEYGGAVVTHMNAPLRDNVLRAVAEIRIDDLDDLDELDDILDEIREAQVKRNNLVHNEWCVDPKDGLVYFLKQTARGSFKLNREKKSVESIEADASSIYAAGMELQSFLMARGLLPPFPPLDRLRSHKAKAARKKRRKAASGNV